MLIILINFNNKTASFKDGCCRRDARTIRKKTCPAGVPVYQKAVELKLTLVEGQNILRKIII